MAAILRDGVVEPGLLLDGRWIRTDTIARRGSGRHSILRPVRKVPGLLIWIKGDAPVILYCCACIEGSAGGAAPPPDRQGLLTVGIPAVADEVEIPWTA